MLDYNQKGTFVAIACGTGVLMFLDLVMYLIRMNIKQIADLSKKAYMLYEDEVFESLANKSFKFILFSCFREQNQVLGKEICETLNDISEKYY